MKRKLYLRIIAIVCLTTAISLNLYYNQKGHYDLVFADIEAIADSESSEYVTCYCALMSDNDCAVNNNGSAKCAGGENVRCWEYDRNCN